MPDCCLVGLNNLTRGMQGVVRFTGLLISSTVVEELVLTTEVFVLISEGVTINSLSLVTFNW